MMKFSIITPTLQRASLVRTCESVYGQTYKDWEHIIQVDSDRIDLDLFEFLNPTPLVSFEVCGKRHNDGGNTCRREAFKRATGDYVIYLDDDNYLAHDRVLELIAGALEKEGRPAWAIFPILRTNSIFFADPPRSCHTDTLNMVLRKDVAEWPETDAYGADGVLLESLKERGIPYVAFPNFRPIGVLPKISFCKADGE